MRRQQSRFGNEMGGGILSWANNFCLTCEINLLPSYPAWINPGNGKSQSQSVRGNPSTNQRDPLPIVKFQAAARLTMGRIRRGQTSENLDLDIMGESNVVGSGGPDFKNPPKKTRVLRCFDIFQFWRLLVRSSPRISSNSVTVTNFDRPTEIAQITDHFGKCPLLSLIFLTFAG